MMKICYFGKYNPEYSRNRVIIKGLKENGAEIIECRSDLSGIRKYFDLIKKHHKIRGQYDILIAGFPANQSVVLAKFLTRKQIVMDAFVSFYDSMVFDRKVCSPYGLRALYYWFLDWLPARLADKILLDTKAHIDYFVKTFHVKKEKFERVFVGTDDSEMYFDPVMKTERDYFLVHYHASFLPLQGIDYIIRAAKILENKNIRFRIIGHGPEYSKIIKLAQDLRIDNIDFVKPVPYEKLRQYISSADIALGIFGQTAKTGRVIPNKIFEAIACSRAIITADEPAVRELFTDHENIIFCRPADPEDLAEKILELKNDLVLREKIEIKGYELFRVKATSKIIAADLLLKLKEILEKI